jgi:hypothetical protein
VDASLAALCHGEAIALGAERNEPFQQCVDLASSSGEVCAMGIEQPAPPAVFSPSDCNAMETEKKPESKEPECSCFVEDCGTPSTEPYQSPSMDCRVCENDDDCACGPDLQIVVAAPAPQELYSDAETLAWLMSEPGHILELPAGDTLEQAPWTDSEAVLAPWTDSEAVGL